MMELIADPHAWIALATLTALEIVLGVDNIVFISVIAGRLPEHQRERARRLGLLLAMGLRILMLLTITWILRLDKPIFTILEEPFTWKDIILICGGLFLLAKATTEIHAQLEGPEIEEATKIPVTFAGVLAQIAVVDLVFSVDSVIMVIDAARGIEAQTRKLFVIAVGVMMLAAGPVGSFVDRHPTIKMLALSFLVLIGMALLADGLGFHIPKGYIYFAMAFSVGVELLNLRVRRKRQGIPIRLRRHAARVQAAAANAKRK